MTLPQKYLLVIIGVGPSGLATAACLREQGVPFVVLERAECIASLWQKRTYDRLKLHLPKQFCHLPKMPFPEEFPEYPTRRQFIDYLESYANHFDINPKFNECVQSARYDETSGFWRVKTVSSSGSTRTELEYLCRWLIVATGENAGCVMPEIEGLGDFGGIPVMVRRQTSHPLDPLSPAEISVAVATVKAAEATPEAVNCRKDLLLRTLVRDSMRFIEVVLQELGKHVVALADAYFFPPFQPSLVPRNKGGAHIPSKLPARRARLVVYNKKSNETSVWIVELSKVHAVTQGGHHRGKVISSQVVPDVQPPMVCWHAIFAYLA